MNRFMVIGFEYNNTIDYCLVRYKQGKEFNQYIITVMNGVLEKLLYNHHVIQEKDGCLQIEKTEQGEPFRLKAQIAAALGDLLGIPVKKVLMPN